MTIKQMPQEYRPDEKFIKFGPQALTGAELLAIILRTGSTGITSVELTENILRNISTGNEDLLNIFKYDLKDLLNFQGVGAVKAVQIKAIAELSKRISVTRYSDTVLFNDPSVVAAHYMEQLRHLKKEVVVLVMLNSACRFVCDKHISQGTVNASLFSPREIFIEALKHEAVNIILLHNHPSGCLDPSDCDIVSTKRVLRSGKMIGINLLDHIIIGDGEYISLKEKGLLYE